jgi:hypothetical protein
MVWLVAHGWFGYVSPMKFAQVTCDALWLGKVRQARAMSAEERVLAGPRLFAGVCERMKEGLRDEHPAATEEEIHGLLLQRLACLRKLDTTRHAIP